jgi:electron transfer flavoprotein alpha subunit
MNSGRSIMGDVLAFAEQRDGTLRGAANEVISVGASLAQSLGGECHALVLGGPGTAGGVSGLGGFGAATVKVAEDLELSGYSADEYAGVVADVARAGGYAALVFSASAMGKDLAPRVAALLDVPLASDVTQLMVEEGSVTAVRPIYSGKAFARVRFEASLALASIRPNAFGAVASAAAGTVEAIAVTVPEARVKTVDFKAAAGAALDVSEAAVVVSGGRGMKDQENWSLLEELRDALGTGAALGASRAVVDSGWRPHGEQVGQTGKTVAPKLYFAVGISGAIQHLAGMRTSQTIVAINKDADAPIFGIADYGIVGDALEILPRLSEEIRTLLAEG